MYTTYFIAYAALILGQRVPRWPCLNWSQLLLPAQSAHQCACTEQTLPPPVRAQKPSCPMQEAGIHWLAAYFRSAISKRAVDRYNQLVETTGELAVGNASSEELRSCADPCS